MSGFRKKADITGDTVNFAGLIRVSQDLYVPYLLNRSLFSCCYDCTRPPLR